MSLEIVPSFLLKSFEAHLSGKDHRIYTFRSFRLDAVERQLTDNGVKIPLTPKAFDVLIYLVERSGHLVEKEELLEKVWADSIVEESNLARVIHTLRRALGEDKDGNKFIETVSKKGYRFVAEVTPLDSVSASPGVVETSSRVEIESPIVVDPPKRLRPVFIAAIAVGLVSILGTVAWTLRPDLEKPSEKVLANGPETASGEAYQHYAQGKVLVDRRYPGDYAKALEHFEKAVELDPNYTNALAGVADAKIVSFWATSSHKDISEARTAVRRAIEINPANAYARTMHCRILTTYDWDHDAALQECKKAVEIDPADHQAQRELAFLMMSLGNESEALQAIDKSVTTAPTSFNKRSRGMILYYFRRYDEAIEQFVQVADSDSGYPEAFRWIVKCYEMKGDHTRAFEANLKLLSNAGSSPEDIESLRSQFQTEGWRGALRVMIGRKGIGPLAKAGIHAQLGEKDLAFQELERLYKRKGVLMVAAAREPALDPIRDDPRYSDLLRRIGLPQ